jgi:hypothetical protein
MLQVGIDHPKQLSIRMIPAVNYSACQAPFSTARQNPDTLISIRILANDFRCSIATAIIDNDDLVGNAEWR